MQRAQHFRVVEAIRSGGEETDGWDVLAVPRFRSLRGHSNRRCRGCSEHSVGSVHEHLLAGPLWLLARILSCLYGCEVVVEGWRSATWLQPPILVVRGPAVLPFEGLSRVQSVPGTSRYVSADGLLVAHMVFASRQAFRRACYPRVRRYES